MTARPNDARRVPRRHALVPALLGCGLLVGLLLVLTWAEAAWSGPLILTAFVACLGTMVLMGLATNRSRPPARKDRHESGI